MITHYGIEKLTLPQGVFYRPFVLDVREHPWQRQVSMLFLNAAGLATSLYGLRTVTVKSKAKAEERLAAALNVLKRPGNPDPEPRRIRSTYIVVPSYGNNYSVGFYGPRHVFARDGMHTYVTPRSPGEGHRINRYNWSNRQFKSPREAIAWIRKTSPDARVVVGLLGA